MSTPDNAAPPAVTLDRVGPGGGVAADSAFGVALVSLWQQAAEDGAPVGFPVPVVRSDVAARVAPLVDGLRTGRVVGVAANRARRLVGVGLLRSGLGNARHTGRIEVLLVDAGRTGSGIGTDLLNRLLLIAREHELQRLEVAVQGDAGLAEFFAAFGFREWGRRPGWIRLGSEDVDEVVLGAQW